MAEAYPLNFPAGVPVYLKQPLTLVSCMALLLGSGCKEPKTDGVGTVPDDTGAEIIDPGDSMTLDITQGMIFAADPGLGEFPGWVGVPNVDDDDEDGDPDWEQDGTADDDNDFALGTLDTRGRSVELKLSGSNGIRVYAGDELLLDKDIEEATLDGSESTVSLRVEFEEALDNGRLRIKDPNEDESFTVELTASPLILNHHLQLAEETMALDLSSNPFYGNGAFIDQYESVLGDDFFGLSAGRYQEDPWVQDEFEFAFYTAPDAHIDVIFDTHRNGQGNPGDGLDDFPEDQYEGPDWLITNWGSVRANSQDYGGNLEVSPPVTVDGVVYPHGRIYYGGKGRLSPQESTRDALDEMKIQKPFMVDSTWLCVGHVDEYTSTIPDPSAPKGFRFVMADTHSAWELLESMDPDTRLPRYSPGGWSGHSIDSVGEIVGDTALRRLNDEVQETLDSEKEKFVVELGLTEEDIIYLPSLFEEPSGCGATVASLIPGMVNMIVSEQDGNPVLFMADPFLRESVADQSSDAMIEYVRGIFPEGMDIQFMDDWDLYHMGLGEVHCGSNVKREASQAWWTEGAHLLSEDE